MPFITRLPALTGADPYPDALLALDFVGARRGPQYYKSGGVTVSDITQIPGWTYTGGTPAGTGSYAPRLDGSLQFFPSVTNLLLQSQTFDNGSWVKTGAPTITADATTAPNGTTTADLWTRVTTAASFSQQNTTKPASATAYTLSYRAKPSVGNYFAVRLQGTYPARADVVFNLSNGTISSAATAYSGFASVSATISADANGYYFVTLTGTTDATTTLSALYSFNSNGAVLDGVDSVSNSAGYIWGAQLELGSTASTYISTTTAAVTVAPPRITDAGYLPEEARTNLLTYSQAFDNAAWTKFAAPATSDSIAAPDGTTTAEKIVPTAANSLHYVVQSTTNGVAAYTGAIYAKAAGYTKFRLNMTDNATGSVYGSVDLTAGTVAMTSDGTWTGGSATISSVGNGWYRVTVTGTRVSGTTTGLRVDLQDAAGSLTFTGDGTSGIYIWQADLQAGSFATSPIPTTSVAVTRAADVGYINAFSAPTDGTMYAESSPATLSNSPMTLGHSSSDVSSISATAGGAFHYNGASNIGPTGTIAAFPSISRYALSYVGTASRTLFANGSSGVSAANTKGVFDRVALGIKGTLASGQALNGPIRRVVIYPRAMSNAELQAITTAGAY